MLSYAPIKREKSMERSYIEQKLMDYMASGKFIKHVEYAKSTLWHDDVTLEDLDNASICISQVR